MVERMTLINKSSSYIFERKYNSKINNENVKNTYWDNVYSKEFLESVNKIYKLKLEYALGNQSFEVIDNNFKRYYIDYLKYIKSSNFRKYSFFYTSILSGKRFSNFYIDFVDYGTYLFCSNMSKERAILLIDSYVQEIMFGLEYIATPVLNNEFRLLQDELEGKNIEKKYACYLDEYLDSEDYKTDLFCDYPVLFRNLLEKTVEYTEYLLSILKTFEYDKEELINIGLIRSSSAVVKGFKHLASDFHCHSKCVINIFLEGEKSIIYKPHSLGLKKIVYKISNEIMQVNGLSGIPYLFIDKNNYGWEENILQSECKSANEVIRCYQRLGILLGVSYFLGVEDLHYENIIINSEYPIIIDIEAVAYNEREWRNGTHVPIRSVLECGILPRFDSKGIDNSILGGNNPNYKKNTHQIRLKNQIMMASCFINEICDGFIKSYRFFQNKKDFLISELESKKIRVRLIRKNSQQYADLLKLSYYPDFLDNGINRNLCLAKCFEEMSNSKIFNAAIFSEEIVQLLYGDIPYFQTDVDKKNIIGEHVIHKALKKSICSIWKENIEYLDQYDLDMQIRLIRLSLFISNNNYLKRTLSETFRTFSCIQRGYDRSKIIFAAYILGNNIYSSLKRSFSNCNRRVFTLDISNDTSKQFTLREMDIYLYNGISGMAIFFAALNSVVECNEFKLMNKILDKELFKYTDNCVSGNINTVHIGCLQGESSLILTYIILFKITNRNIYLNYAYKHFLYVDSIDAEHESDIMYGKAGELISLCELFMVRKTAKVKQRIVRIIDKLNAEIIRMDDGYGWMNSNYEYPLTGMSHGVSGILVAYSKALKILKEKNLIDIISEGLHYENSLFDNGDWKDLRDCDNLRQKNYVSWCHGAGGILLARAELLRNQNVNNEDKLKKDIELCILKILGSNLKEENCLCHGNCGIFEILLEYDRLFNKNRFEDLYNSYASKLADDIIKTRGSCLEIENDIPGLMLGSSGIGYFLLNTTKGLPNILSFTIT